MDVAVIGGGASGALVVAHLGSAGFPGRIDWMAREEPLGGGMAYGRPDAWHLLNVPAGRMSAFPADPNHFVRWLEARDPGSTAETFAPRARYREYLQDVVARHAPERLEHFPEDAVAVRRLGRGFEVELASGRRRRVGAVVLALGHQPPRDLPGFTGDPRYVADPWRTPLPRTNGLVVLVGTGLTMVDVALSLARESPEAMLVAFSRHGLPPLAHAPAAPSPTDVTPMRLRELVRRVREEVRTGEKPWQATIDALRPHVPELWAALDDADRARFLRHVRRYWDVHRHRIAPQVAEELARLRGERRLDLARARLAGVEQLSHGLRVSLATPGGPRVIDASLVVNCTGPASDLTQSADPLLQQLLGSGLARADALSLGFAALPDGNLVDAENRAVPGLFTLGPPLAGVRWETTAIPEIRSQAAALARRLADVASPAARPSGTLPPPWR